MTLMLNNTIASANINESGINAIKTKITTFQSQFTTLK
jgi:hypothetical protein